MALSLRCFSPYVIEFCRPPLPGLLEFIRSAHERIDVCVTRIEAVPILTALGEAKKRGVKVRLVVGTRQWAADSRKRFEAACHKSGLRPVADWRAMEASQGAHHQRFLVADDHRVLSLTNNLTPNGLFVQDSLEVYLDSPSVAQAFRTAVDLAWNDISRNTAGVRGAKPAAKGKTKGKKKPAARAPRKAAEVEPTQPWPTAVPSIENVTVGPDQRVSAYFAPTDGRLVLEKLVETIAQAETEILFALPTLAHPRVIDALEERARAGVKIRGVLDGSLVEAEHFKFAPELRKVAREHGLRALRPFISAGTGSGRFFKDRMNAKLLVVDGRWIFTGTAHFTPEEPAHQADHALWMESVPVARHAQEFVEALIELANRGGHKKADCYTLTAYQAALKGNFARDVVLPSWRPHTAQVIELPVKGRKTASRKAPRAVKATRTPVRKKRRHAA